MILFLYGKDTYRLQQKLREIEAEYKKIHKTGLNLEKLDANQISFGEFWDKLTQSSMFIKKKLFFLENLFSNQKFKEEFLEKISKIAKSPDIIVVFEKKELPKQDKVFVSLKKYGKSQEFKPLEGRELKSWVRNEFQKEGISASQDVVNFLAELLENDLWQIANEIKKVSLYKKREKIVELPDLKFLVKPKIETDIFKTIDALAEKNKKKALRFIQKHLDKGESPFYILKMINFQFRNLLLVRAFREQNKTLYEFLRLKILHPYVAKKAWRASAGFSFDQLKKIYQKIFEADLNIKTGRISPEEGLKWLVAQI
jgi:DNA polymerase-3 subunit delta